MEEVEGQLLVRAGGSGQGGVAACGVAGIRGAWSRARCSSRAVQGLSWYTDTYLSMCVVPFMATARVQESHRDLHDAGTPHVCRTPHAVEYRIECATAGLALTGGDVLRLTSWAAALVWVTVAEPNR